MGEMVLVRVGLRREGRRAGIIKAGSERGREGWREGR